ncbi:MAG TPA: hypothetical protein PK869_16765 [Candidatus Hydrogenedentes bacterium]|nr:hypothetical protein [Candidatus Hydrogenedentota bacterium]
MSLVSLFIFNLHFDECRITTQAQRPGARDAWIANHDVMPGSLQRMVMRHLVVYFMGLYFSAYDWNRTLRWR